jgi:asparagine synthase (glutamine-hydrolysing)
LDSSTITAIIRRYTQSRLDTFSIAFVDNPEFDESRFQRQMAAYLGTDHRVVECTHADIGRAFPEVVWHAETAVLRTAPAPMFLLSGLVHDADIKVVLTGEGADEFLAGYDLFKEMKVRRFWARQPDSELRPLLLRRLYPDISELGSMNETYLRAFYKRGMTDAGSPYYSHALRWSNTARTLRFLDNHAGPGSHEGTNDYAEFVSLPAGFAGWTPLAQAQYLEITTFLSPYLLSSQGDRMAMAHAVEGRYPFLDWRMVEFCNRLPTHLKLRGLMEKWLLKQLGQRLLPPDIWQRRKRPYRAPIQHSFFGPGAPDYVRELLSEPALRESALFNSGAVGQLVRKAQDGQRLSEVEGMALTGILSTQLLHHYFVKAFKHITALPLPRVKIVNRLIAQQASVVVDA